MDSRQKERQQRGDDFQDEIRRSWTKIRSWRMRIADGKGGTRPADEIIILEAANILAEMKRTKGDKFEFTFLRPNQIKGLVEFDKLFDQNYGLVFVSFLNEDSGLDEAYAFRLVDGIKFMEKMGRLHIKIGEFRAAADGAYRPFKALQLERMTIDGEPGYDLGGLLLCYKYL
ncbi:MAG TPA: hypothetical protein VN258_07560 [Mobilitalea sp.]|nr:hypothetical protein [Mobilitalea sp.]